MKKKTSEIFYSEIYDIPVELIKPNPYLPGRYYDNLKMNELVQTVKLYGIIQPVTVRPKGDGYELISGERRIRAAIAAGLDMVPGIIVEADDEKSAIMMLLENLQKEDMCFFEIAESYKNLIRSQGLTQDELAKKIGVSRSAVANKMRLLKLPYRVRRMVRDYSLSERHARALIALGDENMQINTIKRIHKDNLSASDSEKLIESLLINRIEKNISNSEHSVVKDEGLFSEKVSRAVDIIKECGVKAEMSSESFDWGSRFVIDLKKES